MAALTADRVNPKSRGNSRIVAYPILTATEIFGGALVMIDSAGFAVPATAAAGNNGCVGFATKGVNNTGASGALDVLVQEGTFLLDAGSIVQGNVGEKMFAQDDQTVDETQGANEPLAGILEEFVSTTSGWVRMGLVESKL